MSKKKVSRTQNFLQHKLKHYTTSLCIHTCVAILVEGVIFFAFHTSLNARNAGLETAKSVLVYPSRHML